MVSSAVQLGPSRTRQSKTNTKDKHQNDFVTSFIKIFSILSNLQFFSFLKELLFDVGSLVLAAAAAVVVVVVVAAAVAAAGAAVVEAAAVVGFAEPLHCPHFPYYQTPMVSLLL